MNWYKFNFQEFFWVFAKSFCNIRTRKKEQMAYGSWPRAPPRGPFHFFARFAAKKVKCQKTASTTCIKSTYSIKINQIIQSKSTTRTIYITSPEARMSSNTCIDAVFCHQYLHGVMQLTAVSSSPGLISHQHWFKNIFYTNFHLLPSRCREVHVLFPSS